MSAWNPTDSSVVVRPTAAAALDPVLSLPLLAWFVRLRWMFVFASCAVLAVERAIEPSMQRPAPLFAALATLAVVNVAWWGLARRLERSGAGDEPVRRPSRRILLAFAHAQMAVDLLILTAILRYSGGIENPLAVFYVFHMALGSLMLPAGHAASQGAWAILLYAGLALGELRGVIAPHYPLFASLARLDAHSNAAYVGAAIGAMACGIFGTLYLAGCMSRRLRRREDQLRRANEALRMSQTAIHDLQQRRSRFMQTAAHRLKSPLATIHTLAGLVRDDIVHGPDARGICERISRCCDEGIEHVGELLTLARVQDADPQRHRQAQADVCAVVADQCRRFQTVAEGRGVSLEWHAPAGEDLRVHVDPRDLADCIGSLIDNAVKYTPAAGAVSVRVERGETAGTADRFVVVHVDDTGMGFDVGAVDAVQADGASIFDAYRRGNNALAAGISGSGLGLAIVRVVVEQAGGRIDVQSAPGRGTRFALSLPAGTIDEHAPMVRDTRSTCLRRADGQAAGRSAGDGAAGRSPRRKELNHAHR